ncbi:MAG TPA: hypothetical protein VG963_27400 [Polyangiaceae bacterium]|nr:hypothetical protein [Polyangiaceae bacterium]
MSSPLGEHILEATCRQPLPHDHHQIEPSGQFGAQDSERRSHQALGSVPHHRVPHTA